ncbi:MAG: hypothetical protein K6A62_07050, partial [Bacteroidales bacterium]|nr:hypothetical protein [Bacteroidales bacterium]
MKRILWAVVLGVSVVSCLNGGRRGAAVEEAPAQKDTVYPLGFCTDSFSVVTGTISSGDNFIGWMTRLGMSPQRAHSLSVAADSVFDVRKLRAGNTYQAYYRDSSALHYVVYDNSRVKQTVFRVADSLSAWTRVKPVEVVDKRADVTISSSLWV